jgi:hypothetical protein
MTACLVANAPVLNSLLHHATRKPHPYQQNDDPGPESSEYVSQQRRRVVQMPVTGQNSFGSLTRNDGLEEAASITKSDVEQQRQIGG